MSRSLAPNRMPPSTPHRDSLRRDLALGAVAGLLGTAAMTPVAARLSSALGRLRGEDAEARGSQEPSTEQIARRALAPLGIRVEGRRKKRLGLLVHFGYGMVFGALYAALRRRTRRPGRLRGLGFGTALFLVGDEVAVPAFKLAPPPLEAPLSSHLGALAAHWVYGATTDAALRGLSLAASRAR